MYNNKSGFTCLEENILILNNLYHKNEWLQDIDLLKVSIISLSQKKKTSIIIYFCTFVTTSDLFFGGVLIK